ncbi:MAG: GIY-YIG nuclease family protein [Cyclobacteriaceae bacterium]|nr:GIY-YIG nuclease family protein [Cyclobacteriaceae bacterium]
MWVVYIIESSSTKGFYIGHTNNLNRRLHDHNRGRNRSTKGKGPWRFVFQRQFEARQDCVAFEKHLKSLRNMKYIRSKYYPYFL